MTRLKFWVFMLPLWLFNVGISSAASRATQDQAMGVLFIIALILAIPMFLVVIKRLDYIGWSKWASLLLLIPLVSFILILLIGFNKGVSPQNVIDTTDTDTR